MADAMKKDHALDTTPSATRPTRSMSAKGRMAMRWILDFVIP